MITCDCMLSSFLASTFHIILFLSNVLNIQGIKETPEAIDYSSLINNIN